MPKLEPKAIHQELKQGFLWPVYWLHGRESMKSRELLRRIRKVALGEQEEGGFGAFALETLNGHEVDPSQVVDAAASISLGGGIRFIVVKDAQAILASKDVDSLSSLFGPRRKKEELESVCVFLSESLDGRKKFSKTLLEKAAVIPCEEVPDTEKETWIGYLAKLRGLDLESAVVLGLRAMEPWTLDIVDQELEKIVLNGDYREMESGSLSGGGYRDADDFLDAFFARKRKESLEMSKAFANQIDEALPLLGLLSWNVRQLAQLIFDREQGTRTVKLSPYLLERLNRWSLAWKLPEILKLQDSLAQLDFEMKQTPLLPLGLWSSLILGFCE